MNDNLKKYIDKFGIIVVILVPAAVLLIILGLALSLIGNVSSDKDMDNYVNMLINNYKSNEPISVADDSDKYCFIDLNGKKLTNFEYDSATDFHNGYAIVTKNNKNYIINKKFKTVMESNDEIEYLSTYNKYAIGDKLYDGNLKEVAKGFNDYIDKYLIYEKGKKIVVKDYNNKTVSTIKNATYIDSNSVNGYVIVRDAKDRYGIASLKTGKIVYKYQKNYIDDDDEYFVVEDGDNYKTLYIEDDKILIEYDGKANIYYYDIYNGIYTINPREGDNKYYYKKDKKYYDNTDEIYEKNKIEKSYNYLKSMNYHVFKSNDKYGIKKDNKIILDAKYDDISFLSEIEFLYSKRYGYQLVILKKGSEYSEDSKAYVYDLNSHKSLYEYTPPLFELFSNIDSPYINLSNKVCNLNNKKCVKIDSYSISSYGRYFKALVTKGSTTYNEYYNKDMKKIYSVKTDY